MLVDYLPGLITALSIQLVSILSPGPAVAMILGVATSQGRRPALFASLGIACGAATLATATVFGVSAIVAEAGWALMVIRMIGAAYLLWMAWNAFGKAMNPPTLSPDITAAPRNWRSFTSAYLLQISNPKSMVFWLAIASVGATIGAPMIVSMLLILGAFVQSFLGHAAYALLLSTSPVRAAYSRARRWIEAGLGTFFCFASFKLATARD